MPVTLTYTDAYLKNRVTVDVESRAIGEIDAIRTFPSTPINWREKLIVLRAYIITCLEQGSSSDDVFSSKLSAYRKEYDSTLASAHAAANAAAPTVPAVSSRTMEIGRA